MVTDPHDVYRPWAVRARLQRVDQEAGGPKWSLVLLPAPDNLEPPEAFRSDDPSTIYGQPDDAFRAYYRGLLEAVYVVADTSDPDEWLLAPKSD